MREAIERIFTLIQDEWEVAGFRLHILTAERWAEVETLFKAVLRPIRYIAQEQELLEICIENMQARHAAQGGDNEDDDTGKRLSLLLNAVNSISVPEEKS